MEICLGIRCPGGGVLCLRACDLSLHWSALCFGGALFRLFFRAGKRVIPATSDILSPGDGRVLEVSDVDGEGYGAGRVVRIFLSVLDGHVQRAPVAGKVTQTHYRPGSFLDARHPRAPFENESNSIDIALSLIHI